MKKLLICSLVLVAMLVFSHQGFCTTDLFSVGNADDDNLVAIKSTGVVEGARGDYEVVTTDDTLTAEESGITLIVDGTYDITLPADSLGLEYTIVAASTDTVSIAPASGDSIAYLTLDAGDELDSAGAIGDAVSLICGASNTWYIKSMTGTWTDGGAAD